MANKKGIKRTISADNPHTPPGHNYLLAIAIDEYSGSPPLYNCVRDARRLIDLLVNNYQFETSHITTLFNEAATESGIHAAFRNLAGRIGPADNLIVFFSGHGEYDTTFEEGYWVPVDGRAGQYEDYIANSKIVNFLRAIPARHIFVIVDSCFSGSLFQAKNVGAGAAADRLYAIPSRWLLTAGRNEIVSDGKPGDHSPFADNLLYFLENNPEDNLSVTTLINRVVDAVVHNARQTPRGEPLLDVGHRGGQFVFFRRGAALPAETSVTSREKAEPLPSHPSPEGPNRGRLRLLWIALPLLLSVVIWRYARIQPNSAATPVEEEKNTASPLPLPALDSNLVETVVDSVVLENKNIKETLTEENKSSKKPSSPTPESQAWRQAVADNSAPAYEQYLAAFPNGAHAVQATKQLVLIRQAPAPEFTFSIRRGVLSFQAIRGTPPFELSVVATSDEQIILKEELRDPGSYTFDLTAQQSDSQKLIRIKFKDHYSKVRQAAAVLPGRE